MGRSPCCDKIGLKKGPWTPEEDQKLLAYIDEHGHGSWRALPAKAELQRCGKSCRLRWTNYLRSDIKRGKFSLQEEQTIIQLHALLGNRWAAIATHLPKRTDNEIKNYWNTHLKKRLTKMGIDPVTHKPKNDALLSNHGQNKSMANLSHMAQWESARLEAEARLVRQSKLRQSQAHAQNSDTSSPFDKPSGPARCIDGVWGKVNDDAGGSVSVAGLSGDLQSPMSTLSSAAGIVGGMMKEESEEDQWKRIEYGEGVADPIQLQTLWDSDTVRIDSSEQVPSANFVENFTDLLLSTSSAYRSLSEDGGDTDVSGSSGGEGRAGDYYEDNKNYWDSILNLLNSSPANSPLF